MTVCGAMPATRKARSQEPPATAAPLAGLRVVDVSVLAGPYLAMLLGDLGADVIKINAPATAIPRAWGLPSSVMATPNERLFRLREPKQALVGARSQAAGRGAEVWTRLLESADIVVENFLPALEELASRLEPAHSAACAPHQCTITGYARGAAARPTGRPTTWPSRRSGADGGHWLATGDRCGSASRSSTSWRRSTA